jgi:hypothetical protein
MKKVFIFAAAAVLTGVIVTGCGSSKKAAAPVSVTDKAVQKQAGIPVEQEIVFPCQGIDSDLEYFRVNGDGKSKDRTMAKDRAYLSALANLSTKLKGVAGQNNQRLGSSTFADGEEIHDKVIAQSGVIAHANVSGYRTACEKYTFSQQDGSYHCYVTIEFGKQKLIKELYDKLNSDKLLKADYDFDKYMKEFDADLKEYEKTHK